MVVSHFDKLNCWYVPFRCSSHLLDFCCSSATVCRSHVNMFTAHMLQISNNFIYFWIVLEMYKNSFIIRNAHDHVHDFRQIKVPTKLSMTHSSPEQSKYANIQSSSQILSCRLCAVRNMCTACLVTFCVRFILKGFCTFVQSIALKFLFAVSKAQWLY